MAGKFTGRNNKAQKYVYLYISILEVNKVYKAYSKHRTKVCIRVLLMEGAMLCPGTMNNSTN